MLMDEIRVDVLATEAELEKLRKQQQKNEPVEVIGE